jgi:tetratricopeptide (TPR) repeat protein
MMVVQKRGSRVLFCARHLRLCIPAIVWLAAALHAANAQSTSPKDVAAIQALQHGDFAQAIAQADEALAHDPHNCRMLAIRGLAMKNSGRAEEALKSFETATTACPDYLPALEGMAEIQYAQQSPHAVNTLNRILSLQPESSTSHAMLAVLDTKSGNCREAVEHFARAGELIQSNATAEMQYGSCLLALGDFKEAERLFHTVLQREDSEANRMRYAYACWKAKDDPLASEALSPLLNGSVANPQAMTLAAQIAESRGDTPTAVQLLRQAIVANPREVRNYLIFAEISFNHASFQVGIAMLNAGLQQLPQEARLYLARGVLEVELNRLDEAVTDFHQAHRLDPALSFAQDAIGMVLSQRHQSAESLAAYSELSKSHPDDALVHYLYAESLADSKDASDSRTTDAAIRAAGRAVALEPDYQPARDLLCVLEVRAGHLEAAMQQAEEALKRDPEDESAIYQELMAARRLGRSSDVTALVARMKQAHEHQEHAKTNYQLQEIADPGAVNP